MTPDPRLTDAHASAVMLGRVLVLLTLLVAAGVIGAIYHHADKDQPWTSSGTTTQQASTVTSTTSRPHSPKPAVALVSSTSASSDTLTTASRSSTKTPTNPSSRIDTVLGWTAVVVAAGAVVVQVWRLGHDGGRGL